MLQAEGTARQARDGMVDRDTAYASVKEKSASL
jgi:hypothetical protein